MQERLVRGNDDLRALSFFDQIVKTFAPNKLPKLVFITVNHLVDTLPLYLHGLSQIGRIATIIPKGTEENQNPNIRKFAIDKGYQISTTNKEDLKNTEIAVRFFKEQVHDDEQCVIIDIGGYFAPPLTAYSQDAYIRDHLLGIVED